MSVNENQIVSALFKIFTRPGKMGSNKNEMDAIKSVQMDDYQ
jgi:hypothetical protein